MKIFNTAKKIGTYKGVDILVDWKYLVKESGLRKEEDMFQLVLGRFLLTASVAILAGLILYDFSLGNFLPLGLYSVDRFIEVLFLVVSFLLLYSFYLNRDRSEFFDTLDIKAIEPFRDKLNAGNAPKSVKILDFVDHDVLGILDDLIVAPHENIYTNLMNGLIKLPEVKKLVSRLGIPQDQLQSAVSKYMVESKGDKSFQINRLLYQSFVLAEKYGFSYIGEWVVFLKLSLDEYSDLFRDLGVQKETLLAILEWSRSQAIANRYKKEWKYRASLKPKGTVNRAFTSGFTAVLNKYSRDLTSIVARGDFRYAVAREDEIREILRLLRQDTKSAVLLVGEPGVGKTTLLESIAARMVVEDVPNELKDKRLVEFDFQRAIATSKSANDLRKKIEDIFNEVERAKNIVLVIDDLDQLVNIREEIAGEIVSTISKSMERNKMKLVATTSLGGYRRFIKTNPILSNLFDNVDVSEPSAEIALQIIFDEKPRMEKKYGIKIQFDALEKAVTLTSQYDTTRLLPLKAIDTLEDACVMALDENLDFVSGKEVEKVISEDTGISVGTMKENESQVLMNLEKKMHERVIGQDKAIEAVANALRRARAGLAGKSRPIASFLFFGPTGVGKTEVARTLTVTYFGDEKLLTRIDMSEFQENDNIKRLIGYMEGKDIVPGLLTESIREHPFSLVLLDEIEKANPKVLDLFLQILDEGIVTDGVGRKVDFRNTIIIATSNIGSREIAKSLEAGENYEETFRIAQIELRKFLRIEFINRFDKVIMFKPLTPVEIEKIAGLMMNSVRENLNNQGIDIDYSDDLLSQLAEKGYSPVFGAREMRRLIQDEVENKLADLIVSGKAKSGDKVRIDNLDKFIVEK